jgi:hypothetical protein
LSGPPVALSPERNASKLEPESGAAFAADGAGFAAAVPEPALGFSAVHFGGGGLAGLPHEIKKVTANNPNP